MITVPRLQQVLRAGLLVAGASVSFLAHANSTVGAWQTWNPLPWFPVHSHMLPTGKVLLWPGDEGINGDDGRVLDLVTQNLGVVPRAGYDLFCSGHAFLPDGSLLVAGGHISNNVGLAKASVYNATSNTWTALPNMNLGRWYPTVTTLANGDALVVSGDIDTTVGNNQLPQVFQRATNSWRNLSSAQLQQWLYPMMFLAPNGRVVDVAPSQTTRALDTSGTGAWSSIANRSGGDRDYGSAVMFDGKVVVIGGGDPPSNTAEIIDLNQATPTWRTISAPMATARRQHNATLLPDGTVFVNGGDYGPGFDNLDTPVYQAEIWNPVAENWTPMASASYPRRYHSAATLLPDGRVLTTGGNSQVTPEVFSPPYLFKGARPSLTAAPQSIGYGQSFTVQTDQATSISKVTLIRLTSVTHAFNENQRLNTLQFTSGAGSVQITPPASANLAPPGHYLLFVVNAIGIPSIGAIVQLGAAAAATGPTISSLTPNSAAAGSAGFNLSVAGSGFVAGSTVNWNGAARPTTFGSITQLSAQIAAADVATQGTANVTVLNAGAPASNALPFTITGIPVTRYTLAVSVAGAGTNNGSVSSSPSGISCGNTCSASFDSGTSVTLTARAVGRAVFAGWSGACTGTTTCTVKMDGNKAVTANFNRR